MTYGPKARRTTTEEGCTAREIRDLGYPKKCSQSPYRQARTVLPYISMAGLIVHDHFQQVKEIKLLGLTLSLIRSTPCPQAIRRAIRGECLMDRS